MANCADFKKKKSAMEVFMDNLYSKAPNNQTTSLMVPLKYHCELAGKGIEYAWGAMTQYFRQLPLDEKNKKEV